MSTIVQHSDTNSHHANILLINLFQTNLLVHIKQLAKYVWALKDTRGFWLFQPIIILTQISILEDTDDAGVDVIWGHGDWEWVIGHKNLPLSDICDTESTQMIHMCIISMIIHY